MRVHSPAMIRIIESSRSISEEGYKQEGPPPEIKLLKAGL